MPRRPKTRRRPRAPHGLHVSSRHVRAEGVEGGGGDGREAVRRAAVAARGRSQREQLLSRHAAFRKEQLHMREAIREAIRDGAASIIVALNPAMISIGARLIHKENLSSRAMFGIVVSFIGALVVVQHRQFFGRQRGAGLNRRGQTRRSTLHGAGPDRRPSRGPVELP